MCIHQASPIGPCRFIQGRQYAIRVEGIVDPSWSAWFEGMTLSHGSDNNTTITGVVPDQAALHGLLVKVRDMHLTLISVERLD